MTEHKSSMAAIVHERYGRPDVLELRNVEKPVVEDDRVLVRVHASSVNPVEWYGVTGPYFARIGNGLRRPKDMTVGADLAGVVEAVGKDVTQFQPGDEVYGTSGGSWAEYAIARPEKLAPKPANMSFEEAAAVPIAALTALQALRDKGRGPARAEGSDQRRVRGRRHLRRADREGVRSRRDRRVQHEERGAGPIARSRPRRRLHAGELHEAR